jgi:hypothetical protein
MFVAAACEVYVETTYRTYIYAGEVYNLRALATSRTPELKD